MSADEHLQGQLFTGHGRPETKQPAPEPEAPRGKRDPMGQIPGQIGLMTANEITSRYVPNEPDRLYHGSDVSVRNAAGVRLASGEMAKPETDEQLYARKLEVAQTQKRAKVVGRGRIRSIPTLADDIAANGVQNPIALGHEEGTGRPDFVAGGHHRIAVMRHLNANQLLPVLHVRSVGEAGNWGIG